ncbi:ATP-binding protein [Winogradskyella maritima]|uniref:AAA family ATPase n=1 Tax=Winogradskyella maritima TaxID=1517766 RepID=A0ABV8AGB6_9FLAO|nr:ATP-binding protein [Winogradskyella maritima]
MNTKTIVITGGPGTGKTTLINALIDKGYTCFEEISRAVTLKAREEGIEQLFLTEPLKFSEMLLAGRKTQFEDAKASNEDLVFLDRGLPDVLAYMDYIGDDYPQEFIDECASNTYDKVFILAPWQEIFKSDSERYENFDQALQIHQYLLDTYARFGYDLIDVPFGSIEDRVAFILDAVTL